MRGRTANQTFGLEMDIKTISCEVDRAAELRVRFGSMPLDELEQVVVAAIFEHRCLVEADQSVYTVWEGASAGAQTPTQVRDSLMEECLRRRRRTFAQQEDLATLIEMLGYVPIVHGPQGEGETP